MSFRDFVRLAERSAPNSGIRLPQAKLRNAVSYAIHGRDYPAVVAAERAGHDCQPTRVFPHIECTVARYRIDRAAFENLLVVAVMRYEFLQTVEKQLVAVNRLASGIREWSAAEAAGDKQAMLAAARSISDQVDELRRTHPRVADLLLLRYRKVLPPVLAMVHSSPHPLVTLSPTVAPMERGGELLVVATGEGRPMLSFEVHPHVLAHIQNTATDLEGSSGLHSPPD